MNNEIKEILNYLAFLEDIDTQKKVKKVEDYITNLQQENERLNQDLSYYQNYGADMLHKNNILEERIEKAVEKIKKIQQNAIKYGAEHDVIICQELIDTLNGRSDE